MELTIITETINVPSRTIDSSEWTFEIDEELECIMSEDTINYITNYSRRERKKDNRMKKTRTPKQSEHRHEKVKDKVYKYRNLFIVKDTPTAWSVYKKLEYKNDVLKYETFVECGKSLNFAKNIIDGLLHE